MYCEEGVLVNGLCVDPETGVVLGEPVQIVYPPVLEPVRRERPEDKYDPQRMILTEMLNKNDPLSTTYGLEELAALNTPEPCVLHWQLCRKMMGDCPLIRDDCCNRLDSLIISVLKSRRSVPKEMFYKYAALCGVNKAVTYAIFEFRLYKLLQKLFTPAYAEKLISHCRKRQDLLTCVCHILQRLGNQCPKEVYRLADSIQRPLVLS